MEGDHTSGAGNGPALFRACPRSARWAEVGAGFDGKPDALRPLVWSSSGALVYDNGAVVPLKSGSTKIK